MSTVITAFDLTGTGVNAAIRDLARAGRHVFRATGDGAAFGLIAVSHHAAVGAALSAARADATVGPGAHTGVYTEHDAGSTPEHTGTHDEVTFVNCFRVATDRETGAFAAWHRVNEYMVTRPGYLAHTLFRYARPDAAFTFVNIVRWASAQALRVAQDEQFRALTSDLPFVPRPSLCRPVDVDVAGPAHRNSPSPSLDPVP